jgi:hypothetical protein
VTITSVTLTNPGAETGDTTGWTSMESGALSSSTGSTHSGSRKFQIEQVLGVSNGLYQQVAVPGALEAAIDAGLAGAHGSCWHMTPALGGNDPQSFFMSFYASDGTTLLGTVATNPVASTSYVFKELYQYIPANTRFIRIGGTNTRVGGTQDVYWDDFALEVSDEGAVDWPDELAPAAHQLGTYALGNFPTDEIRAHQLPIAVVASAETSNTFHDLKSHQLGVYVLVRGKIDRRDLRAWTFTQDDHDFWVLQLGDDGTLIYDKLSNQWAQWRSPGFTYWRGNDGVQWEGWNICCDTESGKLWIIDPEGRLDDETTPITSIITGGINTRMRKFVPNYMAELTVSEGQPPTGLDEGDVSISLRYSDDQGLSYTSAGSVTGQGLNENITVRWYGLGIIPPNGRIYELTDTGYARRIDAFTVEVGGDG